MSLLFVIWCILVVLNYSCSATSPSSLSNNTSTSNISIRRLQDEISLKRRPRNRKKRALQSSKLKVFVKRIPDDTPNTFAHIPGYSSHRYNIPHVIFSAAMAIELIPGDAINFAGTLRKTGYDGDIVLATVPGMRDDTMKMFKKYDAVLYNISVTCENESRNKVCKLYDSKTPYSVNVIRYYIYRWLAYKYSPDTLIMISDFRDVFFQSNPFLYRPQEWTPPASQLVVFQE
eukprot:gene14332-30505_t